MTKNELIETFFKNHQELVAYINGLTDEQFEASYNGKWTPGQHLSHVYLTLMPFPRVLSSKDFIIEKFGMINRSTWDFDTVIENYLKTSLKAPQQFLPEPVTPVQKSIISADIEKAVQTIQQLLGTYSEEELDTLVLPHPLLGNLTIREMFYLMAYHPTHHLKQAERNLEQGKG